MKVTALQREWAKAFARQALSDLEARELLRDRAPRCQQLHYLQMATEKTCKAHLYASGVTPKETHTVVRKHFPALIKQFSDARLSGGRFKTLKRIGAEIELLAPGGGSDAVRFARPDNAEYPWVSSTGGVFSPLEFPFEGIDDRYVPHLIKILRMALRDYTDEQSPIPSR